MKKYCVIFPPCIRACVNFVNKTLCGSFIHQFSRNSVLGLSQADKRKMRLVTSTVVLWCVAVYVVSATSAPTGK